MRRALAIAATITTVVTSALFVTAGSASADPSADDWYQLRMCESTNRYDINTGNGYYGAYQFDLSTWRSVGGSGYPNDAIAGRAGLPGAHSLSQPRLEPLGLRRAGRAQRGFGRADQGCATGRRQSVQR